MDNSYLLDEVLTYKVVKKEEASHFILKHKGKIRYIISLRNGKFRIRSTFSDYSKKVRILKNLLLFLPLRVLNLIGIGEFGYLKLDNQVSNYINEVCNNFFQCYKWNIIMGTYNERQKLVVQCFDINNKKKKAVYFKIGNERSEKLMKNEINFLKKQYDFNNFLLPHYIGSKEINTSFNFNIQVTEEFYGSKVIPILNNSIIEIFNEISNFQNLVIKDGITYCFSHGDFAPWNLKKTKDSYIVFDWEYCGIRFYGYDLIHYIYQIERQLNKKSSDNAIEFAINLAQQNNPVIKNMDSQLLKDMYFTELISLFGHK